MRRARLAVRARADVSRLLAISREQFGIAAQRAYDALLRRAYRLLCTDPRRAGVQHREDLAGAPCLFHLRHARTRGASPKQPRHFIVFAYDDKALIVLRVLHDSMDIARQFKEPGDD